MRLSLIECSSTALTKWSPTLFTDRQLVALTTFSDLVGEARERIRLEAVAAGLPDDGVPLRDGRNSGQLRMREAVGRVLSVFAVDRADRFLKRPATQNDGYSGAMRR